MKAYHVNEHRGNTHLVFATGDKQWLGEGYYFWQDYEFASEWTKNYDISDIYTVDLDLIFGNKQDDDIIDTVFNEIDYYKFVEKIEYFSEKYIKRFGRKPTLREFNNFIIDNKVKLWKDIVAIRFQDLPTNDYLNYLKVKGFFYKKRIQIVVFDIEKIKKYAVETVKTK